MRVDEHEQKPDSEQMDDLVAIAKVARPHGLRGEVIADVLTDFPERFEGLENVIGLLPNGERRDLKIENSRFQKERVLLRFVDVGSIDEAERLRNAEICVTEDEAVELNEGEFFDWDLAGCLVITVDGGSVGIVKEVMRTGGTDVLVVQGEREYMIPFAETICVKVDIDSKQIMIDPPEGLLDF